MAQRKCAGNVCVSNIYASFSMVDIYHWFFNPIFNFFRDRECQSGFKEMIYMKSEFKISGQKECYTTARCLCTARCPRIQQKFLVWID